MIDIKEGIAKHLNDEFNIDPNVTALLFDKGILSFTACRDLLIKEEYRRKIEPKCKNLIKCELAEKYCIGLETVRKIVEN